MKERSYSGALLMVGGLCIIASLMLWLSGRLNSLMDAFYPLLFGVIFLGEYVRIKLKEKTDNE